MDTDNTVSSDHTPATPSVYSANEYYNISIHLMELKSGLIVGGNLLLISSCLMRKLKRWFRRRTYCTLQAFATESIVMQRSPGHFKKWIIHKVMRYSFLILLKWRKKRYWNPCASQANGYDSNSIPQICSRFGGFNSSDVIFSFFLFCSSVQFISAPLAEFSVTYTAIN